MKVWELIAFLSEIPAGCDVRVSAYPGGTHNNLTATNVEDDTVYLNGDGQYTDDLDDVAQGGRDG